MRKLTFKALRVTSILLLITMLPLNQTLGSRVIIKEMMANSTVEAPDC